MNDQDILRENDLVVRRMKEFGCTSKEISKFLNLQKAWSVKYYCHIHRILLPEGKGMCQKKTDREVAERIHDVTEGSLEYVSGYDGRDSKIRVRCTTCGAVFERTCHNITGRHSSGCPHCRELKRQEREREKERKAEERRRKRELREQERKKKPHPCPVCGTMTTRPKYCCKACYLKANMAQHEYRRRLRISKVNNDKDINLKGLFIRDKGICSICGKQCDFDDYQIKNGAFVAGNSYPSIDHIIPLSKGGTHTWDNIQLAHMICNIKKRDHIYGKSICKEVL